MYKGENIGCEKFTFLKIKYISEFTKMWTLLKFEGHIKNLPNINAKLFQTFNVKSLKTAMVTESVTVQENANAMTIGNQKQTALVIIINWIWLDYSLFVVKWNKTLSEFVCKDNLDCNGKGTCDDSKCDCLPRWDSSADCQGEYCIKIEWKKLDILSWPTFEMLHKIQIYYFPIIGIWIFTLYCYNLFSICLLYWQWLQFPWHLRWWYL